MNLSRKILTNFANLVKIFYGNLIIDARYSMYILVDPNRFKLKARGVRRETDKMVEES
jgi:hypothetical protein